MKINLFKYKRFKDGRCTYKRDAWSSHIFASECDKILSCTIFRFKYIIMLGLLHIYVICSYFYVNTFFVCVGVMFPVSINRCF